MVKITATATEQAAINTRWNSFGARENISFHFWKEEAKKLKRVLFSLSWNSWKKLHEDLLAVQ